MISTNQTHVHNVICTVASVMVYVIGDVHAIATMGI